MAEVSVRELVKVFGRQMVVKGIDLDIEDHSFIVLVGPSGCGKSTTLRIIAGLESASHGEIRIGGRVVNDIPSRDRGVAMVFQSYALYPHMTVRENLGFALKVARLPSREIERRVAHAASILQLDSYMDRRPGQLSGGQRQRVAMGRAIVREPQVFLFDEPLSNLDAKLRNAMRLEIKRLHQRLGTTIIYVTHDQVEAMTMADRIVIMHDGVIEQAGPPLDVFERPANRFVAEFIGSPAMNLLSARLVRTEAGGWSAAMPDNVAIPFDARRFAGLEEGRPVAVGVRPEDIVPERHGIVSRSSVAFEAPVLLTESLGNETLLLVPFAGAEIICRMQQPRPVEVGERLKFLINTDRLHIFEESSGRSLRSH